MSQSTSEPRDTTPESAVPPPPQGESAPSGWFRAIAIAAAFATLIILAAWLRGAAIWPEELGLDQQSYDDEGVYASAAQLIVQGKHPYRDFFYAHPPLGPVLLAPAVEYHFTTWGSPTSLMLLRYASVTYGALTVGLVFLIAWRLWGLAGGLLAAGLLALDPRSIWISRHVMLEGPLFFLSALAVLAYVLAREEKRPPPALLLLAGFFAAAAGGVKVQGLIVLAAMIIDLLIRQRATLIFSLLAGALILWLPLWGYLFWLSTTADPLGQIVFFQLLRPGDGIIGRLDRLKSLWESVWLLLAIGGLALAALPALLLRPSTRPRTARPRRGGAAGNMHIPRLSLVDGKVTESPSRNRMRTAIAAIGSTSRVEPEHPSQGWTLLLPWLAVTAIMLLLNRSFYNHYEAHLSLPLSMLAGALPLVIWRALRASWAGRAVGVGLAAAACALVVWLAPATWRGVQERPEDRIMTILSRYGNNAVGPDAGILALDAQISFRAARRPAREDRDRFLIDSYGTLLYHGLGIEGTSLGERLRRVVSDSPGNDPYAIIWRPAAQAQLRASIDRSDLVIIDETSSGRLSDETRRWLESRGQLAERQDRYVIYRIRR